MPKLTAVPIELFCNGPDFLSGLFSNTFSNKCTQFIHVLYQSKSTNCKIFATQSVISKHAFTAYNFFPLKKS